MTPAEAHQFLSGRINYEQRAARPEDLTLDRIFALLRRLGDPQARLRIVHVAGSKGKGSTSAMIAAVLRAAGLRTGLFTSPHLVRFEERIQVDNVPVAPETLAELIAAVRPAVEACDAVAAQPGERPTFFEIATALGFLHFARATDAAVIEVGLGGRFDSTNVCSPVVSLITSISHDHTQQLGPTLASIAFEKAGIVKPNIPAISGATDPEVRRVIEDVCRERGAPLTQLGVDFAYDYEPGRVTGDKAQRPRVRVRTARRTWPWMGLGLLGEHQAANAAVAVACVERLREQGWDLSDAAVASGLANVSWPARLEVVGRRPLIILDCAHNIASARALTETLRTSFPGLETARRRLLVFASSSDKDVAGILRELAPLFTHAFLTRYSNSPRSVPPEELGALLRAEGSLPFTLCATPEEALDAARAAAGADDLICVTGSVFLAGELRPTLVGA
jgi:dihydrofolate synthase / folylpolyglutamate synthase